MGIFQQFPYSNFHEFNLDQIIKIMREMQDEWEATKTEWASYKDFIDNYFENLDVSEEVLEALRTMASTGELNNIIDPTIAAETAAWLADHITQPTTPVVDTSLSVPGAAADAEVTGDRIDVLQAELNGSAIDELTPSWIYSGKYQNNSGGLSNNPDWVTSDFIPITKKFIAVNGLFSNLSTSGLNIGFYTAGKTYVAASGSSFGDLSTITVFTVPDSAKYARISNTSAKSASVKVYITDKSIQGIKNIALSTRDFLYSNFTYKGSKNLINPKTRLANSYVSYATGNIGSSVGYSATDYIPIDPETEYTYSIKQDPGAEFTVNQFAYYDNFYNYISGVNPNVQTPYTFTTPKNAYYVRFTEKTHYVTQLEKGSAETVYVPYYPYFTARPFVTVGSTGDFTSILEALKNTPDYVDIHILSGEYDLIEEYKTYYGNTFWDDYTGYAGETDPFYRGLWFNERRIIGIGDAIIKCVYTGNNNAVNTYFSAIANGNNTIMENVTIQFGGLRYAIHDDFGVTNSTIVWKNIRFRGSSGSVIGGGLGINSTYIIEGCVFELNNGTYDINYHGSTSALTDNMCKIIVANCYGQHECKFAYYGASEAVTQCIVNNSKFGSIVCDAHTPDAPNVNMRLIEWCNETN